jgi:hypothetical protein
MPSAVRRELAEREHAGHIGRCVSPCRRVSCESPSHVPKSRLILFASGAEEVCGSDPGGSVSSLAACGDAVAAGSPTPAGTPEQQEEEKEKVVESEESGAATAALRRCSWVGVVMATAVVGLAWA